MKGITLVSDLFHVLTFSKLSFSCFRSLSSSSMWSTLLSSLFFACFSSLRVFFSFSVSSVLSTIKRDRGISVTNHLPDGRPIRLVGTYKFHNQTLQAIQNWGILKSFPLSCYSWCFLRKTTNFFILKKWYNHINDCCYCKSLTVITVSRYDTSHTCNSLTGFSVISFV